MRKRENPTGDFWVIKWVRKERKKEREKKEKRIRVKWGAGMSGGKG